MRRFVFNLTCLGLDLDLAALAANIDVMLGAAPGFLMLGFRFLEPEDVQP